MSIEADLENAVIAHIKANISLLADKAVDAYAGQSPQEWFDSRVVTDPACLVHVGESNADEDSEAYQFLQTETEFFVYVKSRNIRSSDERRQGIYDILEDIRNSMHGAYIGGVQFRLVQQGAAFVDQRMNLYFQRYSIKLQLIG